jgi:protein-disulfide isomerase
MNKGKNNNSSLPLIIIGAVLIAALAGAWWLFNRNSNKSGNTNRAAANTSAAKTPSATNVLGAQPPNLLGSPNATVTVEEFADFQCGACASVHPRVKELTSIYGSRIKFIFRNYPLAIPAHDKAYNAAVAAEAAGLQGRFWDMQNLLFTNQQVWTNNPDYRRIWEEYAAKIGLDVEKFKNDMAGLNTKSRVDADMQRGRALNLQSTPTIFINGQSVPFEQMTVEIMRQVIDAELQKASSSQQNPTNSAAPGAGANTAANK